MTGLLPFTLGRMVAITPMAALITAISLALLTGDASARPPECELQSC